MFHQDEIQNNAEVKINFLKKQQVIIKIWTSGANIHKPGSNVGHVAIQTAKKYMSLWPKQACENQPSAKESEGKGVSTPISHQFNAAAQDILYEGREAEYIFCLYTLDSAAIDATYSTLEKSLQGWSLVGGLLCDDAESCASLAWKLLEAGGIKKLVSTMEKSSISGSGSSVAFTGSSSEAASSSSSSLFSKSQNADQNAKRSSTKSSYSSEMAVSVMIASPDAMAELIKQAKINELKNESLTEKISYPLETQIEKTSSCTIS